MVKQADKLFAVSEYKEAMFLYSELVSNYPDNYKYNYCYGICILKAGKLKPRAIPFLERAAEISITTDYVFYYLAKAYAYAHRFDEAIQSFNKFSNMVSSSEAQKYLVDQEISNCKYATERYKEPDTGVIVDKTEILTDQVVDKSNVEPRCGKYILLPKKYLSKNSTEADEKYAFLTATGQSMYFTYFKGNGNYDIARIEKKDNGNWGKVELLPDVINSRAAERFPVYCSDENALYFSSSGHQGYGGMDIFVSKYDLQSGEWSQPENLKHPVNSVYDDLLYHRSPDSETASFVSDRNAEPGVCNVYEISFKKKPGNFIEISGELQQTSDLASSAYIQIFRASDGKEVYSTFTEPTTGTYNIDLPAYGEYNISVKNKGFQPEVRGLSLIMGTPQKFKQQIVLKKDEGGEQQMFVNNYYEGETELLAEDIQIRSGRGERFHKEIGNSQRNEEVKDEEITDEIIIVRPGDEIHHQENVQNESTANNLSKDEQPASEGNRISAFTDPDREESIEEIKGVIFKIQIGAFKETKAHDLRSKFNDHSLQSLDFKEKSDGTILVLTGESRSFRGILSRLRELKSGEYKDAFPVAFYNGKQITVEAAKEWLRKQN